MSFILKYKKDISDLLKKNKNIEQLNKKKLEKNNLCHTARSKVKVLNMKYLLDDFEKNRLNNSNHNTFNNKYNSINTSLFKNKKLVLKLKINKGVNDKIDNKIQTIGPYIHINYRNHIKNNHNNCLSGEKRKFKSGHFKTKLSKSTNYPKRICDDMHYHIKSSNKNYDYFKHLLLKKNIIKYKAFDKREALTFCKKINKVYDQINLINTKNILFNKSTLLFAKSDGLNKVIKKTNI